MTEMMVHLDKEQTRIRRHGLLKDDVYVLFHDILRQFRKEGTTGLSPVEAYLSAKNLASQLLSLPNVMEGIDDELDDLEDEAEGENDAMIVGVVATAVIWAAQTRHDTFDHRSVILRIYSLWKDHALFMPLLRAAARKEEAGWMEGKRVDMLTCELVEMERDGEDKAGAEEVCRDIVDLADGSGLVSEMVSCALETANPDICRKLHYILSHIDNQKGHTYEKEVNRLYDMTNRLEAASREPRMVQNTFNKESCVFNGGSSMNGDVTIKQQKK